MAIFQVSQVDSHSQVNLILSSSQAKTLYPHGTLGYTLPTYTDSRSRRFYMPDALPVT